MKLWAAVKRLRIEPFIALYMFAFALEALTITQLAQDKICLFKYNKSSDYCSKFSEQDTNSLIFDTKDKILSDVTTFATYRTVLTTIPIIFWSLFLGAWADRHERAPKFLMGVAGIAVCVESALLITNAYYFEQDEYWMLLSIIPVGLVGGQAALLMSIFTYVTSTTKPENRSIRFAILEALLFCATPIGIFVGGDIVGEQIQGSDGQLHRYTRVFWIGLIAQILATVWIFLVPLEKPIYGFHAPYEGKEQIDDNLKNSEQSSSSHDEREPLINKSSTLATTNQVQKVEKALQLSLSCHEITHENNNVPEEQVITIEKRPIRYGNDVHWYVMFKDLLDLQNMKDMWKTCTKERSDGRRGEIWIFLISMPIINLTINGGNGVMFQFVQKVFEWDASLFSIVNASTLLITSLSVIIIVPTLIKVFKLSNMALAIVGLSSMCLQNLIRGTILNPVAFYFSYAIGSLSYVPPIAVRSKLSTIVEDDEENKVFGLLSCFETITPFFGSLIYNTLFSATIATYPGLVFQFSVALLVIPFIGFVYVANYCQ